MTFLKRFKNRKLDYQKQKIALLASQLPVLMPTYLDAGGKCYHLHTMQILDALDENFIESFYKANLPSFEAYNSTQKVVMNITDFQKLVTSHGNYIQDVAEITGRSQEQVMVDFEHFHKGKQYLLQPSGLSGVVHKVINTAYTSFSMGYTVVSVSASHLSGITGCSLLGSAPALVIAIPLVGGVFFAGLERLAANTPLQPALIIARDVCLIPTKIAEISYNQLFIGPVLRSFNIDAPLNVTSMLKFGAGTKSVLGSALNTTLAIMSKAVAGNLIN